MKGKMRVILAVVLLTCSVTVCYATPNQLQEITKELSTIDITNDSEILENAGLIGFSSSILIGEIKTDSELQNTSEAKVILKYANRLNDILYGDKNDTEWDESFDLTAGSGGGSATLNCIWTKAFTDTQHYSICTNHSGTGLFNSIQHIEGKKEIENHKIQSVGNVSSCTSYIQRGYKTCTDSCGFRENYVQLPHTPPPPPRVWVSTSGRHFDPRCTKCPGESTIFDSSCSTGGVKWYEMKDFHNKSGILSCDICKQTINPKLHQFGMHECVFKCGFKIIDNIKIISEDRVWNTKNEYNVRFTYEVAPNKGDFAVTIYKHTGVDTANTFSFISTSNVSLSNTLKEISVKYKINDLTKPINIPIPIYFYVQYTPLGDTTRYLGTHAVHHPLELPTPIPTKPVEVLKTNVLNEWATSVSVKPTFKLQHALYLDFSIWDSTNTIQLTPWQKGTPTGNLFEFTTVFGPQISADLPTTFIVRAAHKMAPEGQTTFTLEKTDVSPPNIKDLPDLTNPWTTEKTVTVEMMEEGSGEVQIAFNDESNYSFAKNDGTGSYSRSYRFTGDVYTKQTRPIFIKDKVGNVTSLYVEIDKIDGTVPLTESALVINNLNLNQASIEVTSTDIGSGVDTYAISLDETPIDWHKLNTFIVNSSNTYNLYTKDIAGNVSAPYRQLVDIDRPTKPDVQVRLKMFGVK